MALWKAFADSAAAYGVGAFVAVWLVVANIFLQWPGDGAALIASIFVLIGLPIFVVVDLVIAILRRIFAQRGRMSDDRP